MAAARVPHVVPAGYQRFFAEERVSGNKSKHFIRLIGKRRPDFGDDGTKIVSVRDAFTHRGFLSIMTDNGPDDHVEDRFAIVERRVIRIIARISFPTLTADEEQAVRELLALLIARSYRARAVLERGAPDALREVFDGSIRDPEMIELFAKRAGRMPGRDELAAELQRIGARFVESGLAAVQGMLSAFASAMRYLSVFRLQLVSAESLAHGFVISDNPVVVGRGRGLFAVAGPREHFALGDSERVFAPLSRTLGVCLSADALPPIRLTLPQAIELNNAMWRGAFEFIGAHPDEDWSRACGGVSVRDPRVPPAAPRLRLMPDVRASVDRSR